MRLKKIVACTVAATMVLGSLSLVTAQSYALVDVDAEEDDSISTTMDSIDCGDFWTSFSDGFMLDTDESLVITGVTTNNGSSNWDNMIFVLYSSDDGDVYSATITDEDGNEVANPDAEAVNYTEYFVGRADNYGWGTATYKVISAPEDDDAWAEWLAATQEGMEFTVTVTYEDGTIEITSECGDAVYVATYEVGDADLTYYFALTGEQCSLTELTATWIDLSSDDSYSVSEDLTDVTCDDFWTSFSEGLGLHEDESLVITSTTTNNGSSNWDNMIFVLYSSDDGEVYSATITDEDGNEVANPDAEAVNYTEYFVGRADNYGWGTATYKGISAPEDDDAWAEWLAATQEGMDFTITAVYTDGSIEITCECGDCLYEVSYEVGDSDVYYHIALTGEQCELTDLTATWSSITSDEDSEDEDTEDEDSEDEDSEDENSEDEDTEDEDTEDESEADIDYTTPVATVEIDDLTAEGFWTVFSEGLALVDGESLVITGTTASAGDYNWDNMIFVLYSSDDAQVYAATITDDDGNEVANPDAVAANYVEYFVGRADNYGWGTASYVATSAPEDDDAWAEWLAATQAGQEFTITAVYVDGTIQITSECGDAVYVVTYEVEDPDLTYYIALTGEQCELTDLVANWYAASEEDINNDLPDEDESENTEDESESEGEDQGELSVVMQDTMECGDFWTTFTDGFELPWKETLTLTFTTTSNGTDYWDNAVWVLYSSDSGYVAVDGADSEAAVEDNYVEYWVGRVDYYGWGVEGATYEVISEPDDWDAWYAATQAGAPVTITAYLDDAVIDCSCGGYEYVVTIPVDTDRPVYIALSGEDCTLSDLTVDGEEQKFPVLTYIPSTDADTDEGANGDGTGSVSGVKTGDVLPVVAILVALCGCAVILVASRKRRA